MRELLRAMPAGVPSDCLLSRIRGRRSFLVGNWDELLLCPDPLALLASAPWRPDFPGCDWGRLMRMLRHEYAWAFARMEEPLREIFVPFFWMAEVRTLAICLRNLAGGREADAALLGESLLCDDIRGLIQRGRSAVEVLNALTSRLTSIDTAFARLTETYLAGGSGAVETALGDISLEYLAAAHTHPAIGRYLAMVIDGKNLVGMVKQLRWRPVTPPRLLRGGEIPLSRIEEIFVQKDSAAISRLATRIGGRHVTRVEPAEVEQAVLEAQGRSLQRMAREADGIGAILHYLWRCGIETRNLALLSCQSLAGIDEVSAEMQHCSKPHSGVSG